jgi:CheY-like chemotaxis protein
MELSFIVIDDSELDHFIAKRLIRHINADYNILHFLDPNLALEHIKANVDTTSRITLIILDIYMPMMTGFEFIEAFEKLDRAIQDKYYIVALSSTRERADLNRISTYTSFKDMITKPVTIEELQELVGKINKQYGITE